MRDEDPVIGHEGNGDAPRPPISRAGMIGAAVVAAGVLIFASGAGAPPPSATTSSTTTTTSTTLPERPSIPVPPTAPPGEIVDRTMRWEVATGFDEATSLAALVEFDGAYWATGRTPAGAAVWRSDGARGDPWEIVTRLDGTEEWYPRDLDVVGGELVMTGADPNGEGNLSVSADGRSWEAVTLPSGDPNLPLAHPYGVYSLDDRVVVAGTVSAPEPDEEVLLDLLDPAVADLVRSGVASLDSWGSGITVHIDPGLEIDRIPVSDLPEKFHGQPEPEGHIWNGSGVRHLTASAHLFTSPITVGPDGALYMVRAAGIATSTDGVTWETTGPPIDNALALTPWREGLAVDTVDRGLLFWAPGYDRAVALAPEDLSQESRAVGRLLSSGDWGLSTARYPAGEAAWPTESVLLTNNEDGEVHLYPDMRLELVRGGEPQWSIHVHQQPARVNADGQLVLGGEERSVVVEVDEWLDTVSRLGTPASSLEIVHTPDGERWSITPWEEIIGHDDPTSPTLLSTDDFLMVADMPTFFFDRGPVRGVVIGRPAPDSG